jgi:hypothetical protein
MKLDRISLQALIVDSLALDHLPRLVATEYCILPIGFRDETLHFVVPIDFEAETGRMLRFIIARDFTADHAERELIAPLIDYHYAAAASHILNCSAGIKTICPMYWMMLDSTAMRDQRRCRSCDRTVHFCYTQAELDHRRNAGDCVAVFDPPKSGS